MKHKVERYHTIIVDSDLERRMRLRQATAMVQYFGEVTAVSELREAISKLQGDRVCDVIFMTSHFPQEEIDAFVKEAKQTKHGQDTAYVLLVGVDKQDSADLAKNIMGGLDGFLLEPYSVDSLVDITRLAAKIKGDRRVAREKAALNLLISKIITQLDVVAYAKRLGSEGGHSVKQLKELGEQIQRLTGESLSMYHELAIEAFCAAPLPKRIFKSDAYAGASSRVKQRMEKKLMKQLGENESKG